MTIGKYEGNTSSKLRGGFAIGQLGRLSYPTSFSLLGNFHIHPGGTRTSSPADEGVREDWKMKHKSTMFYILTNSSNDLGYEKTDY